MDSVEPTRGVRGVSAFGVQTGVASHAATRKGTTVPIGSGRFIQSTSDRESRELVSPQDMSRNAHN